MRALGLLSWNLVILISVSCDHESINSEDHKFDKVDNSSAQVLFFNETFYSIECEGQWVISLTEEEYSRFSNLNDKELCERFADRKIRPRGYIDSDKLAELERESTQTPAEATVIVPPPEAALETTHPPPLPQPLTANLSNEEVEQFNPVPNIDGPVSVFTPIVAQCAGENDCALIAIVGLLSPHLSTDPRQLHLEMLTLTKDLGLDVSSNGLNLEDYDRVLRGVEEKYPQLEVVHLPLSTQLNDFLETGHAVMTGISLTGNLDHAMLISGLKTTNDDMVLVELSDGTGSGMELPWPEFVKTGISSTLGVAITGIAIRKKLMVNEDK